MTASPKKKQRNAAIRAAESGAMGTAGADAEGRFGRFSVVMVGRPNVGKSTLFNRLVRARGAIVDRIPGTTRDWTEGDGTLGPLQFTLYDTGGLEDYSMTRDDMSDAMLKHTERALRFTDVVLFLIDGRVGVTEQDAFFSRWLKSLDIPGQVITVPNKCESLLQGLAGEAEWEVLRSECFRLGFGEAVPVSAEHGDGLADLYDVFEPFAVAAAERNKLWEAEAGGEKGSVGVGVDGVADGDGDASVLDAGVAADGFAGAEVSATSVVDTNADVDADAAITATSAADAMPLRRDRLALAIVGRPNVGKSTLVNTLLQEERVMTGPQPGVTRDSTTVQWHYNGQLVELVDTAGIRRWGSRDHTTPLEALSVGHARRALGLANVVVLMCDATEGLTKWDLSLAKEIIAEGRALVVALNKMDAVDNDLEVTRWVREQLATMITDGRGVQLVALSALEGDGVDNLMPAVLDVFGKWNSRVSTGKLNRWFERLSRHHPPPAARKTVVVRGAGRDRSKATKSLLLKLKYITQINTRPPTFALFANRTDVPEPYRRFLVNALRSEFELEGVPIRLLVRASSNPFTARRSGGAAGAAGRRGKQLHTPEGRRAAGLKRITDLKGKRVRARA